MAKPFIPIILGTARKGRRSEAVANFVLEQVNEAGIKTRLIDVADFGYSATPEDSGKSPNKAGKSYRKTITKADGLIIVSPEYNHGYPGELKMALDQIYEEYQGKPVGIVGVSNGPWGGTRMTEQLRLVLIAFGMIPTKRAVNVTFINKAIQDKVFQDKDGAYAKRVQGLLEELLDWMS